LNLTFEVLEGQATRTDKDAAYAITGLAPLLEVQVVETADSMTYDAHDTDDAVKLQLVTLNELAKCRLVGEAVATVRAQHADLRDDLLRKSVVHQLIDRQVSDVLATSSEILTTAEGMPAQEVRRSAIRIAASRELTEQKRELERFLYDEVYRHPRLIAVRAEAQSRLKEMFELFRDQPERLPPHFQARGTAVGLPRAVGDYLAGMTDRYCDQQYRQHVIGA
jgi:dGTPase